MALVRRSWSSTPDESGEIVRWGRRGEARLPREAQRIVSWLFRVRRHQLATVAITQRGADGV